MMPFVLVFPEGIGEWVRAEICGLKKISDVSADDIDGSRFPGSSLPESSMPHETDQPDRRASRRDRLLLLGPQ